MNKIDNKIFLICPYGLGDTFYVCGYKDALEKKYNATVHFFIKPTHVTIMNMYGIYNYTIKTFDHKELSNLGKSCPQISPGKYFVAHPGFLPNGNVILNDFHNLKISFVEMYRIILGLDKDSEFKYPTNPPKLSNKLKDKLDKIAPLNKIILISPESFSTERIVAEVLKNEVKHLKDKGYTVISNVIDKKELIKGSIYLPLSLDEAIAIGINCAEVITVRSGFADIILPFIDKITIYYPNKTVFDWYSLQLFSREKNIKEMIMPNSEVKKIGYCFQYKQSLKEENFSICINLFSKKYHSKQATYFLFGIPMLKIKLDKFCRRYYLFNFIPIFRGKL